MKPRNDSQYYSKLALDWLIKYAESYNTTNLEYITYGNLDQMEDLYDAFGGNRKLHNKFAGAGEYQRYRFGYVLDRLDRETKKPDALFTKCYINYPGIINSRTRAFKPKYNDYVYCRECLHLRPRNRTSFNITQCNFICIECLHKTLKGAYGIFDDKNNTQ